MPIFLAIAAVVSAVAPVVAKGIGDAAAGGDVAKARELAQQAIERFGHLIPPELKQAVLEEQAGTEYDGIKQDPSLRAAQMKALESLGREVDYNGQTPEDALAYSQARGAAGSMDAGFRGALNSQMAQRGLGGGGMEYASALQGQQAAVNRGSQMSLQAAADARQRKLQAINSLGSMAGSVRGQDWQQGAQRASAQDAINRYNNQHAFEVSQYNNQTQLNNYGLQRQHAVDMTTAEGNLSDMYLSDAERKRRDAAQYGAAISQGVQSIGSGVAGAAAGGK